MAGHQGKSEEPGPLVTWSERGVVVRHLPNWPNWIFRLTPVAVGDRTIVASVEISAPTGEPVTVYAYKRVPIGTLLRLASDPTAAVRAVVAGLVPDADALKRRPYSTEHLCAVIDVYRYAISQDAPTTRHARGAVRRRGQDSRPMAAQSPRSWAAPHVG